MDEKTLTELLDSNEFGNLWFTRWNPGVNTEEDFHLPHFSSLESEVSANDLRSDDFSSESHPLKKPKSDTDQRQSTKKRNLSTPSIYETQELLKTISSQKITKWREKLKPNTQFKPEHQNKNLRVDFVNQLYIEQLFPQPFPVARSDINLNITVSNIPPTVNRVIIELHRIEADDIHVKDRNEIGRKPEEDTITLVWGTKRDRGKGIHIHRERLPSSFNNSHKKIEAFYILKAILCRNDRMEETRESPIFFTCSKDTETPDSKNLNEEFRLLKYLIYSKQPFLNRISMPEIFSKYPMLSSNLQPIIEAIGIYEKERHNAVLNSIKGNLTSRWKNEKEMKTALEKKIPNIKDFVSLDNCHFLWDNIAFLVRLLVLALFNFFEEKKTPEKTKEIAEAFDILAKPWIVYCDDPTLKEKLKKPELVQVFTRYKQSYTNIEQLLNKLTNRCRETEEEEIRIKLQKDLIEDWLPSADELYKCCLVSTSVAQKLYFYHTVKPDEKEARHLMKCMIDNMPSPFFREVCISALLGRLTNGSPLPKQTFDYRKKIFAQEWGYASIFR